MKKNNKDLLIEEYDSQFLYQTKKNNLNISFNRIAFIFFVFVIVSIIFSTKTIFLGSLKKIYTIKIYLFQNLDQALSTGMGI